MLHLFRPITCFVFDMDGVLTDGKLLLMPDGEMVRTMNVKDGYALQLAIKQGYQVMVISGGNSATADNRLRKLGITEIHFQITDKAHLLGEYLANKGLRPEQVLFMGDDMPDLPVVPLVGLVCAPADACTEMQQASHYVSAQVGGAGCVRDVIEKVLKLNGHWQHQMEIASK